MLFLLNGWCSGFFASHAAGRGSIPGCGKSAGNQTASGTASAANAHFLVRKIPLVTMAIHDHWRQWSQSENNNASSGTFAMATVVTMAQMATMVPLSPLSQMNRHGFHCRHWYHWCHWNYK